MVNEIDDKSELDVSKERLAKAFRNLEVLIDGRLTSDTDRNSDADIEILEKKISEVVFEKEKLETSYSDIYEKYANIKLLNLEVVEELNKSIKDIEDILDSNYGDNS